eukprot:CAMPEP_0206487374 /NCGR_PEP_ID=MMETSP0324_2-20121206/41602_1 /ASSEMBLY_ACC=CAM_ASM_000836 /TAXON_ID=2866 /ORGANISM="Crypthecodinium cohnii, Strain Seligo" /LENGTH=384 /DNA_ID=CAMNT_0053965841 /DNA_START=29 /DNA_END=1180 /DNA_ORIENTATION=+
MSCAALVLNQHKHDEETMAVEQSPASSQGTPVRHSILGPPYRWLQIDCQCYYSENLYVHSVNAYFRLPSLNSSEAEFWAANNSSLGTDRSPAPTYNTAQRADIYREVMKEACRRAKIPEVYRTNLLNIAEQYTPLHPELFLPPIATENPGSGGGHELGPGLDLQSVFTSTFLKVWKSACSGEPLPQDLRHVHDACFECSFLQRDFCLRIKEELKHFKTKDLPHLRPNSMNRNGCILNEIGLGPLMDRIVGTFLLPVCNILYPELLETGLSAHHSFIVDYAVGQDVSLGVHDDNSEITINVALSEDYEGGSLALYHRARVEHPQRLEKKPYYHRVGMGTLLMHPGELLHEVLPLTSGERQGLIIWMKSDGFRKTNGCALCRSNKT